ARRRGFAPQLLQLPKLAQLGARLGMLGQPVLHALLQQREIVAAFELAVSIPGQDLVPFRRGIHRFLVHGSSKARSFCRAEYNRLITVPIEMPSTSATSR